MKATLSADGTLVLTPESGCEAYALACWYAQPARKRAFAIEPQYVAEALCAQPWPEPGA